MGQAGSKGLLTPLECILKNFSDFKKRAGDYGEDVDSFTLRKLCELEWPTFGVGWPKEGTLDFRVVAAVRNIVFGNPGHPDQVIYITVWIDITIERPKYLKDCGCKPTGPSKVLLASQKVNPRRPVLPSAPESPPRMRRAQFLDERPLSPAPAPPPPYPEVPAIAEEGEEGQQPDSTVMASPPHTRSGLEFGAQGPSGMYPLRETGERDMGGRPMRTYVPFTTSDLYNWKNQNPSFSQAPDEVISLLESVFYTHQPTWDDCQQLLRTLFTTEERERVRTESRREVRNDQGVQVTDEREIEAQFPATRPDWDPNTGRGNDNLERYRQILLRGLRAAARKPTNLSKITEVRQGADESPTAYLERLYQAYRTWSPIDPRAPENQAAIVIQFVSQSAPDIRKKIQKIDGFQGKSLSELVAIAQKVFDQREDPAKATHELTQKMAKVLLAQESRAERGSKKTPPGKGRPPLGKNQCAYCKEEGHWKKNCPKLVSGATPVLVEELQ
uniref:Gag protein n=2 Tax=Viruses TaxID=10239 RepID=A0A1W6I499_FOWPV|nr:gag protein [Reticuloendotheliosis virus]ARM38916.1 gag protein [Fowlpox virus]AIG99438.1 gag protein [Reticuloendotheliosis virus]UJR02111.1 gag protein [Fowlpox virus]UJR02115.1 gag protein [Reticuloendotheliosis virus]